MEHLWWALWGLGGAAVYASSRFITAVWGDAEIDHRGRVRAWAQFAVALLFGPIAAGALTAELVRFSGGKMGAPAVALAIGISANALWPLFVEEAGKGFRRLIGSWFVALGERMSKEEKS